MTVGSSYMYLDFSYTSSANRQPGGRLKAYELVTDTSDKSA
jgi:hypothetical protein